MITRFSEGITANRLPEYNRSIGQVESANKYNKSKFNNTENTNTPTSISL